MMSKTVPVNLDPFICTRLEMADFAKQCYDMGVNFIGGCCLTAPHHIRAMSEAVGKETEASKYSPDLSKHYALGTNKKLDGRVLDYAQSDFA